jgi:SAM-dependent methyltransferase
LSGWRPAYETFRHLFGDHARVLDFGCGEGVLLKEMSPHIGEGVGVDLDERVVANAVGKNSCPNLRFIQGEAKAGLPFPDGYFDVITAMAVLEHVGPEEPTLQEFHRLLRPGGHLVIEVPSRGPFELLDIGNIKYRFPFLHRWFYVYVARQPKYYEEHFGANAPMFGQFSRDANWHKHYSIDELSGVAQRWFRLEKHIHYGRYYELLQFVEILATRPFGKSASDFLGKLFNRDYDILSPSGGAFVVGIFRKPAVAT